MAVSQQTKTQLGLDDRAVLDIESPKFGGGIKGTIAQAKTSDQLLAAARAGAQEAPVQAPPVPFANTLENIRKLLAGVAPGQGQAQALARANTTIQQGPALFGGTITPPKPPQPQVQERFFAPKPAPGIATQISQAFAQAGLDPNTEFAQMLAAILPLLGGFGGQQAGGQ
jgi:hypothetical protein